MSVSSLCQYAPVQGRESLALVYSMAGIVMALHAEFFNFMALHAEFCYVIACKCCYDLACQVWGEQALLQEV